MPIQREGLLKKWGKARQELNSCNLIGPEIEKEKLTGIPVLSTTVHSLGSMNKELEHAPSESGNEMQNSISNDYVKVVTDIGELVSTKKENVSNKCTGTNDSSTGSAKITERP